MLQNRLWELSAQPPPDQPHIGGVLIHLRDLSECNCFPMAAADLVALCTRISLIRKPIVVARYAESSCYVSYVAAAAAAGMTFIDSVRN